MPLFGRIEDKHRVDQGLQRRESLERGVGLLRLLGGQRLVTLWHI